jgi:hypothetical protein
MCQKPRTGKEAPCQSRKHNRGAGAQESLDANRQGRMIRVTVIPADVINGWAFGWVLVGCSTLCGMCRCRHILELFGMLCLVSRSTVAFALGFVLLLLSTWRAYPPFHVATGVTSSSSQLITGNFPILPCRIRQGRPKRGGSFGNGAQ